MPHSQEVEKPAFTPDWPKAMASPFPLLLVLLFPTSTLTSKQKWGSRSAHVQEFRQKGLHKGPLAWDVNRGTELYVAFGASEILIVLHQK